MRIKLKTTGRPEMLTDLLRENGVWRALPCGGQGTCGKCAVRVLHGEAVPMLPEQEKLLRQEGLLAQDAHLGCQLKVCGDLEIEFAGPDEKGFYIPENRAGDAGQGQATEKDLAILIDIGTTTICLALTDAEGGAVIARTARLNRQRQFGADVISRIRAAQEGHADEMRQLVLEDLTAGMRQLLDQACISDGAVVKKILLAGNTTMLHLLRGRDASGLGHYPFTPVSLEMENITAGELLGDKIGEMPEGMLEASVTIFPGISAFVGADIVAGLSGIPEDMQRPWLFLDLGTNAEMALVTEDQLFVTSAAAGPAFEGGNISCGSGSIPGAVTKAWLQYGLWRYETIDRKPPVGICGSGLISAIAALLKDKMMDRHGTLDGALRGKVEIVPGRVSLAQADIRAFQEAKAAVRSGIAMLLVAAGLDETAVETVCLAGGFGGSIDIEAACTAGLLPEIFEDKTIVCGNTVLEGLHRFVKTCDNEGLRKITEKAVPVNAAMQKQFEAEYVKYLDFDHI